jgi:excisionase family DNA binding protein
MDRLLLKPSEAAELLAISRAQTYSLLAQGILPGLRVGHSIRIPLDELLQWVREQTGLLIARERQDAGKGPRATASKVSAAQESRQIEKGTRGQCA